MKKMINTERIEGRVYQHNLTIKTVQNQLWKRVYLRSIRSCSR